MILLSQSETEDLTEHLRSRQDIWMYHKGSWIRKDNSAYALALRFTKLRQDCFALTYRDVGWSSVTTEEYVHWLLDKYTAYSVRESLKKVLRSKVMRSTDVEALSREVFNTVIREVI